MVLRDAGNDQPAFKRMPFAVTLGERTVEAMAAMQELPNAPASEAFGGLQVRDMNADELAESGVKAGVKVTDVAEGSAAADEGIQPNDIIEEVGGKPASGAREFNRLLRVAKTNARNNTRTVVLLVNRDGETRFVAVRLDN